MSSAQPFGSTRQAPRDARVPPAAVDASVDALCELGESALERASLLDGQAEARSARDLRDAARDHGFEAARMALHAADAEWEIGVLLRVSELFDRLGDHDDAIALQCRAAGLMTCQAIRSSGAVAPLRP